jgi:hypothetical protein
VERNNIEDPGIYERIILKRILKTWDWKVWTGFIWPRIGTDGGCYEHCNEPSGSIGCGELVD